MRTGRKRRLQLRPLKDSAREKAPSFLFCILKGRNDQISKGIQLEYCEGVKLNETGDLPGAGARVHLDCQENGRPGENPRIYCIFILDDVRSSYDEMAKKVEQQKMKMDEQEARIHQLAMVVDLLLTVVADNQGGRVRHLTLFVVQVRG